MSILKDFYTGTLRPVEHILPSAKNYRPLVKEIESGRTYFAEQLVDEDKERFQTWLEQIDTYESLSEYENFSYGFRLGAKLALEVFAEPNCE